jgi:imidazole glycerol-phosphate synthase subunit HisF
MFRPRVIPVLLLLNKGLVKTIGFKKPAYVGDPMNAIKIFNELEADELIFLDITASKERRTMSHELVKKIGSEAFMPFAVGGGVDNIESIKSLINAGAEKVVINTGSVLNPGLIEQAASKFGSQSIIVSIDYKKNLLGKERVYIHGGTKATGLDPVHHAVEAVKCGAGEVMINSIQRDGTMSGFDNNFIRKVVQAVDVPVIACGGAGTIQHLRDAVKVGNAHAVAAGSMFVFHGVRKAVLINYPDKKELSEIFL